MFRSLLLAVACLVLPFMTPAAAGARPQWTPAQAKAWYARQAWPVGSNYVPASAINQLEMWQPDTFNPQEIDRELGWAETTGMTTMRVFLQDQLWTSDPDGFKKRIDRFLTIATKHRIRPVFVLFDSCWNPNSKLGKQPDPVPGVHNSGWVQSPGSAELNDPAYVPKLEAYVKGVIGAFAHDDRILGWDIWNEPHEGGTDAIHNTDDARRVTVLLPQVFAWARAADPDQPITSGVFDGGDWSPSHENALTAIQKTQLDQSDIISFHSYAWPEEFENRVVQLEAYGRPVWCTEYMARSAGSTIDTVLPIGHDHRVAMFNWGFVDGKTQTRFPWDSWEHPYVKHDPVVWFHDLYHKDGTPYRLREIDIIRTLTNYQTKAPN